MAAVQNASGNRTCRGVLLGVPRGDYLLARTDGMRRGSHAQARIAESEQGAVCAFEARSLVRIGDRPAIHRSTVSAAVRVAQYRNRYWNFVKNARLVRCMVVADGNR